MRDRILGAVRIVVLAVTLGTAGWGAPVIAQSVQKCIAADGHVTLTSGTCADGHRLAGTYDAVPEQVAAAGSAKTAAPGASPGSRAKRAGAGSRRSASGSRGKSNGRCQAARDRREQTLRRVGLKRTFDLLRKLDDEVWAACR